jgi:hypothetical protein
MSDLKAKLDDLNSGVIAAIQSAPEAQPGEWQRWSYMATFLLQLLELIVHKHAPAALMAPEAVAETEAETEADETEASDEPDEEESHTGRGGRRRR